MDRLIFLGIFINVNDHDLTCRLPNLVAELIHVAMFALGNMNQTLVRLARGRRRQFIILMPVTAFNDIAYFKFSHGTSPSLLILTLTIVSITIFWLFILETGNNFIDCNDDIHALYHMTEDRGVGPNWASCPLSY